MENQRAIKAMIWLFMLLCGTLLWSAIKSIISAFN